MEYGGDQTLDTTEWKNRLLSEEKLFKGKVENTYFLYLRFVDWSLIIFFHLQKWKNTGINAHDHTSFHVSVNFKKKISRKIINTPKLRDYRNSTKIFQNYHNFELRFEGTYN